MNGAELLVHTAVEMGIEYCFANPGTTEMPLVAALECEHRLKPVLSMFEGVCTGAADGYGRIAEKPAMTLTHLGPGFANGIANLHNARRANSPIVNLIGDHATWHLNYDPPLASDIESLARPVSSWVKSSRCADGIKEDFTSAVKHAWQVPGQIATHILPMDLQSKEVNQSSNLAKPSQPVRSFDDSRVEGIARQLKNGKRLVFIVGDSGLSEEGLLAAGRLAQVAGVKLFAETFPRVSYRGGGLPDLDRLPYFPEVAIAELEQYDHVVCAGVPDPISYFGYEGIPSRLAPEDQLLRLADVGDDVAAALAALADAISAPDYSRQVPEAQVANGDELLSPQSIGQVLSAGLPEDCIVSVEGGTCGYPFFTASVSANQHRVMTNTGGAIGQGIPVALGAALAERGNTVVCLQSDGSAQYTIQALWTIARENLPVVVLIAANHRYGILQNELRRHGIEEFGPRSLELTELDKPKVDWQALAKAYGVNSACVTHNAELASVFQKACAAKEPFLIEMAL